MRPFTDRQPVQCTTRGGKMDSTRWHSTASVTSPLTLVSSLWHFFLQTPENRVPPGTTFEMNDPTWENFVLPTHLVDSRLKTPLCGRPMRTPPPTHTQTHTILVG